MGKYTIDINGYIKKTGLPLLLFFLLTSSLYNLVSGDRGIIKMIKLQKQINLAKTDLNNKQQEKTALETNVKKLSDSSLDLDLLDERAREVLKLVKKDEFIIFEN